MLDLLIDLMASVSAMGKASTRQETLRQIHECENSLKAIQFRLDSIKARTASDNHEGIQLP